MKSRFPALLVLLLCLKSTQAQTITAAEYFVGADPGVGNGTAITVSSPDDAVPLGWTISTGSLTGSSLYRVNVRVLSNGGQWGAVHAAYFATTASSGVARLVTELEYAVDGGSYTTVDVSDGASVNWNQILSTAGFIDGLHRVHVRARDDLGRLGAIHDGLFVVSNPVGISPRVVTQIEYWLDSNAPTLVDVADAGIVNWTDVLSTAGLDIGLHMLNARAIDDLGRIGPTHRSFLIVSSPFVAGEARTITAAEFYVNADPGEGNGIPIHIPFDGAYDEGEERVDTVLTDLPIGLHQLNIRLRDDLGRWSKPAVDSLIVGPVLVVKSSGSDMVLNWQSGDGVDQFRIYRSLNPVTGFTVIDSTAALTYTDVGAAAVQLKQFYYVTFEASALSSYRLPGLQPVRD